MGERFIPEALQPNDRVHNNSNTISAHQRKLVFESEGKRFSIG
jgi:hypothetical protein